MALSPDLLNREIDDGSLRARTDRSNKSNPLAGCTVPRCSTGVYPAL